MFIGIDVFNQWKTNNDGSFKKDKYNSKIKEMMISMCSTVDTSYSLYESRIIKAKKVTIDNRVIFYANIKSKIQKSIVKFSKMARAIPHTIVVYRNGVSDA